MSLPLEVGPLTIEIEVHRVRFYFSDPLAMSLEIPPSFEAMLQDAVELHRDLLKGHEFQIDLANMPAISSRQMGMILTVREVCRPYGGVALVNTSSSVQQLLRLTGTQRFFDRVS
ncbi:MAG: hypothetical protein HJJLKODD_01147 [Phycisphaerae bacterium]|nr:hypothetical protein [Phycisphaerae bacterium]